MSHLTAAETLDSGEIASLPKRRTVFVEIPAVGLPDE